MIKINKIFKNYFLFQLCVLSFLVISCKKDVIPTVRTKDISNVSETSATSGGYIISDGGSSIMAKGVCWNTTENPTIANNKINDEKGINSFSSTMTGLLPNTTYYVRAYVTNEAGTGYGNSFILKTFTGTVSDVDGNVYYTVTINDRIWMAENLKTTKYSDGSPITYLGSFTSWVDSANITQAYCWNNDDINNKNIYGAIYNWYGAMNGAASSTTIPSGIQGVCPTGWHLPSDREWRELETFLGGDSIAGGKMKEPGITHWLRPNEGATNESGFTSISGGYRHDFGTFYNPQRSVFWWSSNGGSESDRGAYYFSVYYSSGKSRLASCDKDWGCFVRCIKDY